MARAFTFPQDLIDSFRSNEVVGVIGSGLSAHAGFPSWHRTLELMIAECQNQLVGFTQGKELKTLLRKYLYQEVAEECAELLRGDLYRNFIQDTFRRDTIIPSNLHHLLSDLPLSAILTTNYDNLIERTYAQKHPSGSYPLTFTSKNVAQLSRLCSEKRFFIFKMHGDADDIESVVFKKKDYQDIIHSNRLYQVSLGHIFAARAGLFIGYGLRDLDLDLILGAQASLFKGYGRRHYAFFPDEGKALSKSYLKHYNITIIPYSSKNNHKELQLMLGELSRQIRARPPSTKDEELERLKQLMDFEKLYCEKLGTYIELERARYLRSKMSEPCFTQQDREFIKTSIQHWEALADEKARLMTRVLAIGATHEFGNVLAEIQEQSSILACLAPEGPLRQSADEIVRAAKRGGSLVTFLRSWGEHPRINLNTPTNINDLLAKIKGVLSTVIGDKSKLILEQSKYPLWVTCSPPMIEQVVLNLVVNALDAAPHNAMITMATTAVSITNEYLLEHPDARIGSFVCMSVTDNGRGISAKDLPHIFKPFFSSKKKNGAGLGLPVSQEIVGRHNGWIEVETLPRRGSTFSVFLPEIESPK